MKTLFPLFAVFSTPLMAHSGSLPHTHDSTPVHLWLGACLIIVAAALAVWWQRART